jgi:hypothetical protein
MKTIPDMAKKHCTPNATTMAIRNLVSAVGA